jgi:hypothetical protein
LKATWAAVPLPPGVDVVEVEPSLISLSEAASCR